MQYKPPWASTAYYYFYKNVQTIKEPTDIWYGHKKIYPSWLAGSGVGDPTTEQLRKSDQHWLKSFDQILVREIQTSLLPNQGRA